MGESNIKLDMWQKNTTFTQRGDCNMNEVLKTISKRFSCRSYTEKKLEEEHLSAIAQAAIEAPSGMNRQGWQVIIVKDKHLIDEMDVEGMKVLSSMEDKSTFERIMSRGGRLFYNAPCMVVIAITESNPKGAELIDLGILAQNIVLAATSLGIDNLHCGFVGVAFAGEKAAYFKRKLQFPEGYECGLGVLLGYAKEPGQPHVPDKDKITVIE
jgi:nitroreductase